MSSPGRLLGVKRTGGAAGAGGMLFAVMDSNLKDLISFRHTAASIAYTGPNQSQDRSHGFALIFVPT